MIMGVKMPITFMIRSKSRKAENNQHRALGATRPRGQAELLLEVRARAREHHEAHRKARKTRTTSIMRR